MTGHVLTAGQVAEALWCLEWNGRKKWSAVAVQGTLWEASVLCGEPRPADGTWLNPGTTLPAEILVFAARVLADVRAWAGLLEYEQILPAEVRALPDVVRLRELARSKGEPAEVAP